jgi:hypothetical protein
MRIAAVRALVPSVALATAVLVAGVLAVPAFAQQARPGLAEVSSERGGFWLGGGLGVGVERLNLDDDGRGYSDALARPTISLRLGGTVSPALRLGGEIFAWINESGDATETISSLLFIAQYYPLGRSGLFLKGGAGIGRSAVDFDDGFGTGDTGFAGSVGAGYEIRLSRRLFLTPTVDLMQHRYGGRIESYDERILNFGLGVTYQRGRN